MMQSFYPTGGRLGCRLNCISVQRAQCLPPRLSEEIAHEIVVSRVVHCFFVAFVLIVGKGKGAVAIAQDNSAPPSMHSMDQWAADHAALLDAELAGLKAGVKLTPDQEMLSAPFETAVREAAKMRMEHMHGMMERMDKMRSMDMGADMNMDEGHPMSPIDRLDMMATHLMQAGTALKKVADAAKPLYASLDNSQKRVFASSRAR